MAVGSLALKYNSCGTMPPSRATNFTAPPPVPADPTYTQPLSAVSDGMLAW